MEGFVMTWGTFTPTHLASLASVGLFYVIMEWSLKRLPEKTQIWILGLLSLTGFAAGFYNLTTWGSPWEYLPLHLCSLNAMILPFAVFTRNKVLGNLLLLWSLGAAVALVLNGAVAACDIRSWTFFFYYTPHVMECIIPVLLFRLRLVKVRASCLWSTVGITMGAYTLIHWINVLLNDWFIRAQITNPSGEIVQVNYMYSLYPTDPVLGMCWNLLPVPYWYMFLAVPIIIVYLALIYGIVYYRRHCRKLRSANR
jgi:uncharacterized membrane protein YwaF